MANTKGYSVSATGASSTGVQSAVYSYSGIPGTSWHCGRRGAYDGTEPAAMAEGGRVPTLQHGDKSVANHDVTAIKGVTTSATRPDLKSTKVVCTTTTTKGNGAGLIVSFTTTNTGAINATPGNYTVVDGGESYATDDTVEIDGFPGSVLAVTAA